MTKKTITLKPKGGSRRDRFAWKPGDIEEEVSTKKITTKATVRKKILA